MDVLWSFSLRFLRALLCLFAVLVTLTAPASETTVSMVGAANQALVEYRPQLRYPQGMTMVFNGARLSKIIPCGCRARNLGGVDKEAAMLKAISEETSAVIKVDAGGLFKEFIDPSLKLQTYYLLESVREMKYDVLNVGYTDFKHGLDMLKNMQKKFNLPFVSANIVDAETKKPFFDTHKILHVKIASGKTIRVGVIGVTAPSATASNPPDQVLPPKPTPMEGVEAVHKHDMMIAQEPPRLEMESASRWAITDDFSELVRGSFGGGGTDTAAPGGGKSPALEFALDQTTATAGRGMYEVLDEIDAVEPIAQKLRGEVEVLVLLCFDGPGRTKRIAETLPFFDVVVAGDSYTRYDPFFIGENNNTLWVSPEHEGRFLGKVEFRFDEDGTIADKQAELLPVDQNVIPVPALTRFIDLYKRDTAHLPPPPSQKLAEKIYVGANRCNSCHPQAFAQWKTHKHSHAMKALIDKKMEYNPDCLRCHTVAYNQPGGFTDLRVTPFLSNVQCESCHGPGKHHIEEERKIAAMAEAHRKDAKREQKMKMNFDSQFCMQCHDPDNDPNFDFALDIHHVDHDSTQPNRTRLTTGTMSAMRI